MFSTSESKFSSPSCTFAGGAGTPNKKMAQSSPFQTYSEKKERRKSTTETIPEVDEEDDSPIRSDDASNWLVEEEFIATNRTTADDSTLSTTSSPMQFNSSPSTSHVSPASNATSSPINNRMFESQEPQNIPAQSTSVNKYDNTKHKSSYQSAVIEKKEEEILEEKIKVSEEVHIPSHSDLKERSSPSPVDSKEMIETLKTSHDKNAHVDIINKNIKNDKVDTSNENKPSFEDKEYSRTTSGLSELTIVARDALPLVPARNNFSPYLTPPLGSEEEETLEV